MCETQLNDRVADIGAIYKGIDERDGKEHYFVVEKAEQSKDGWPRRAGDEVVILRCLTDPHFDEDHAGRPGSNIFEVAQIMERGLSEHARSTDGEIVGSTWASGGFAHCWYEHRPDLTLESVQALISEKAA